MDINGLQNGLNKQLQVQTNQQKFAENTLGQVSNKVQDSLKNMPIIGNLLDGKK